MKTISKALATIAIPILLSSTLLGQAYTTPVGAVSQTLPSGAIPFSFSFQHAKLFQGTASAVNGAVISVDVSSISLQLMASPHMVQVLSGPAVGQVATIVATNGTSVTTDPAITGLSDSDVLAIRKHVTLSDFQTSPELADTTSIAIYNATGSVEVYEYLSSETLGLPAGLWVDVGGEDASSVAIFPGEGLVFNNAGDPVVLTQLGTVSIDPVLVPVGPSFNLVGTLNPLDTSTLGAVFSNLAVGSTLALFSSDGNFIQTEVYEQLDLSDLGLGEGTIFLNNSGDDSTNDIIPASSALVVNPAFPSYVVIPPVIPAN